MKSWIFVLFGVALLGCSSHVNEAKKQPGPFASRESEQGKIQSYIYVNDVSQNTISKLKELGVDIDSSNEQLKIVQGWIPSDNIQKVAALPFVVKITPPTYRITKQR